LFLLTYYHHHKTTFIIIKTPSSTKWRTKHWMQIGKKHYFFLNFKKNVINRLSGPKTIAYRKGTLVSIYLGSIWLDSPTSVNFGWHLLPKKNCLNIIIWWQKLWVIVKTNNNDKNYPKKHSEASKNHQVISWLWQCACQHHRVDILSKGEAAFEQNIMVST